MAFFNLSQAKPYPYVLPCPHLLTLPQFLPRERIPNIPPAHRFTAKHCPPVSLQTEHCGRQRCSRSMQVGCIFGPFWARACKMQWGQSECQEQQALHGGREHTLPLGAGCHPHGEAQAGSGFATPAWLSGGADSRTSRSCGQVSHAKDGSCFSSNPPKV